MIEKHELYGKGIGYTDARLLFSGIIHGIQLGTLSKWLNTSMKTLVKVK